MFNAFVCIGNLKIYFIDTSQRTYITRLYNILVCFILSPEKSVIGREFYFGFPSILHEGNAQCIWREKNTSCFDG